MLGSLASALQQRQFIRDGKSRTAQSQSQPPPPHPPSDRSQRCGKDSTRRSTTLVHNRSRCPMSHCTKLPRTINRIESALNSFFLARYIAIIPSIFLASCLSNSSVAIVLPIMIMQRKRSLLSCFGQIRRRKMANRPLTGQGQGASRHDLLSEMPSLH